jgi:hypothetical protein
MTPPNKYLKHTVIEIIFWGVLVLLLILSSGCTNKTYEQWLYDTEGNLIGRTKVVLQSGFNDTHVKDIAVLTSGENKLLVVGDLSHTPNTESIKATSGGLFETMIRVFMGGAL